jgi:alkanesulfonate monooxygenase
MPIEICGIIGTAEGSESGRMAGADDFDVDYITKMARAHDAGDFDRVLIGYRATSPDGWQIASHVLHVTDRLGVFIAHRAGFVQPTLFARQAITLDRISGGGRITIHFINGGDEADQHRDGDYLDHDSRYRRAAEYMQIVRDVWTAEAPFDHDGEFYRFEGAFSPVKPAFPGSIQMSFGGMSEAALETGARFADVYATWGEPLDASAEFIKAVTARASTYGRMPKFHASLRVILGDTEEAAWTRADAIADAVEERIANQAGPRLSGRKVGDATTSSVGAKRLFDLASRADVQDERLYMRISRLQASGGNTAALVGTPEQVAESILKYYEMGFTNILIRGFDPRADALEYGDKLIPLVRQAVAQYDLARSDLTDASRTS